MMCLSLFEIFSSKYMPNQLLSKIFFLFTLFCLILILLPQFESEQSRAIELQEIANQRQLSAIPVSQNKAFVNIYQQIINSKNDDLKLNLIEKALNIAQNDNITEPNVLRTLHVWAANIHKSRWHFLYAISSLNNAQSIIFDSRVEKDIKRLQSHLIQIDKERGLKTEYIATKDTGPSKSLSGKILIAYVFIDDGITTRWSNKTKFRSQQVLNTIQTWQKNKGKEYGISEIEFVNQTYIARKNPLLKQLNSKQKTSTLAKSESITFKSSNKAINQFVNAAMNSLGAKNVAEFLQKEMQANGVKQAVLIMHTNQDQRSFARRCGYTHQRTSQVNGQLRTELFSNCTDEYVMLMEQVKRNRWDKLHYAQAHEIMHVFGAADLYNIKNASNYAVTDIMNFQSKQLTHSNVSPITAYAIGWQKEKPKAPFNILER